VPLFFGFMSKQLIFEMKFTKPELIIPLEVLSILPSILVAMQSFKIIFAVLPNREPALKLKSNYSGLLWSPGLLAILTLTLGFAPELLDHTQLMQLLLNTLMGFGDHVANLDQYDIMDQSGWFSLLVAATGLLCYILRKPILKFVQQFDRFAQFGPSSAYRFLINHLPLAAASITKKLQNGDLRVYLGLVWLFLVALLVLGFSQLSRPDLTFSFPDQPLYFSDLLIVIFVFISAFSVIWFGSTISSLLALGVFGLGMALIFLLHGAPDVAMTQILVELLLVIFFVINLYRLPILRQHKTNSTRANILAATLGCLVFVTVSSLMFFILAHPLDETVNQYYLANSLVKAHGQNVVNVILIDFRGLDTLGEILVITASAIGVFGLTKCYPGIKK